MVRNPSTSALLAGGGSLGGGARAACWGVNKALNHAKPNPNKPHVLSSLVSAQSPQLVVESIYQGSE